MKKETLLKVDELWKKREEARNALTDIQHEIMAFEEEHGSCIPD